MIYLKAKRAITRKMLIGYHTNYAVSPIKKNDVIEVASIHNRLYAGGEGVVKTYVGFTDCCGPFIYEQKVNFAVISEKEFCKTINDKHLTE